MVYLAHASITRNRLFLHFIDPVCWRVFSIFVVFMLAHVAYAVDAVSLPISLPAPPVTQLTKSPFLGELTDRALRSPSAFNFKKLADEHARLGNYVEATRNYLRSAEILKSRNYPDEAFLLEKLAASYAAEVRIFVDRQLTPTEKQVLDTKAILEPHFGTLLGAYIDEDKQLKGTWTSDSRLHRRPKEFETVVGRDHATYFMYVGYGRECPVAWLAECKRAGVIPHLALEPNSGVDKVQDDDYLRRFAQQCGALKWPIFLRYASEMNGGWTANRYRATPALYREKFRLVNRVFDKYAPSVATVWCINSVPIKNIQDYYPGDDGCDWVGINVYNMPYYENSKYKEGLYDTALTFIKPAYDLYSARKPIAICEFAASYMTGVKAVDQREFTDFAVSRMAYLYQAIPRFFPRIKMVSWFSVNTLDFPEKGKLIGSPNNYALTENEKLKVAYREVLSEPYYIGAQWRSHVNLPEMTASIARGSMPPRSVRSVQSMHATRSNARAASEAASATTTSVSTSSWLVPRLVKAAQTLQPNTRFSLWIKTRALLPKVFLSFSTTEEARLGKLRLVYAGTGNGVHYVSINPQEFSPGLRRARVFVYDDNNRFMTTAAVTVAIGSLRDTEPTSLTGTVRRYYSDQSGLVSAMDIETLGSVERVHFDPTKASSIINKYPLFSDIDVWVRPQQGTYRGSEEPNIEIGRNWNLVGLGEEEPTSGFTAPYTGTAGEQLEKPFTVSPLSRTTIVEGTVNEIVVNSENKVVAVILNSSKLVQIPPSLRKPASAGSAVIESNIRLGNKIKVFALRATPGEGLSSAYNDIYVAEDITVNGHDVDGVNIVVPRSQAGMRSGGFRGKGSATSLAQRNAILKPLKPAWPIFDITTRGIAGNNRSGSKSVMSDLGLKPLFDPKRRPW